MRTGCALDFNRRLALLAGSLVLAVVLSVVSTGAQEPLKPLEKKPEVPYMPTHEKVVAEMLKVAKVGKDDILYDLGSGDGRIVITAAKEFGTRGVGVDIDPDLIREARENAIKAGVADKVTFYPAGSLRDRHPRRHRCHPLSAARDKPAAAPQAPQRSEARHPRSLSQPRHG